jgi:ParB-like chromosome segregation protein Spo0J
LTAESPISFLHPDEIQESPENPREITPERFEALKHSLRFAPEMMLARPVIVDSRGAQVVAGNMRHRAAKALLANEPEGGFAQKIAEWGGVPCYVKEFTDAEKREWMLRDNNGYGNWVPDELVALVAAHEDEGGDMRLLGFSEQEVRDIKSIDSGPDLPPEGDALTEPPTSVWGVVIDCDTEEQQVALLEEFAERGLTCRALLV